MLSTAGLFRGLGIINGKFVGALDNAITPYCVAYTFFLSTFAYSCMFNLLPLTIDRAIAVMLPLRHNSMITTRTCVFMCTASWTPALVVLIFYIIAYTTGYISVTYNHRYHRCMITGGPLGEIYEEFALMIPPFFLIILLYVMMLIIVIRQSRRIGRFLVTATGIITTSLLTYCPTVISATWNISLSYEVAQILTVTVYYLNGILNPLIYVATHPVTRDYLKTFRASINRIAELGPRRRRRDVPSVALEPLPNTVCLPDTSVV